MLILNFTHPLTPNQQSQIEALANTTITEIRTIPVQIDQSEPLEPQITAVTHGLRNEMYLSRANRLWTCFEQFVAFCLGTTPKKLEAYWR